MQDWLATIVGAGAATGLALLLWAFYGRRAGGRGASRVIEGETAILLRMGAVIDWTQDAELLLDRPSLEGASWADLRDALLPRFPDLPEIPPTGRTVLAAANDPSATLAITAQRGTVRVILSMPRPSAARLHRLFVLGEMRDRLQTVLDSAPLASWITDSQGELVWRNDAFGDLRDHFEERTRPPFDLPGLTESPSFATRASIPDGRGGQRWFEVTAQPFEGGRLHFAKDIGDLVAAEMAQRNFVQTLSKTFAHLPIGLAVFDRDRRLVLFNPALVDLTRLPADFLSTRPNLMSFLDQLREKRMMPEPKNYVSWREQLGEMITAARNDRFCETWTLESGLTYKVTGRPHPDGAVAFLFEDISAEISLTRRFRSELELTQSVIDSFEDGIAVFSQMGVLTFCNEAYRKLWEGDSQTAQAETNILDATRHWQAASRPSQAWAEIRDFVLTRRQREIWETDITLKSGQRLLCRVEPVAGGASMLRFTRVATGAEDRAEPVAG